MKPSLPVKFQFQSITTRLLSVVFSIYLILAISVTVAHIVADYQDTKSRVLRELIGFHETFEESVTQAMWELDEKQLEILLNGAMRVPSIIGAKVVNQHGIEILAIGIRPEPKTARSIATSAEVFGHSAHMIYRGDEVDEPMDLGVISLYSSEDVVFERVRVSIVFIVVNAVVKTIALWCLFIFFGRTLLRVPLERLSDAAMGIDYDRLRSESVSIKTGGTQELATLENSFNRLLGELHRSIGEQKQTEAVLRESEERFRSLANVSPVGILYTDADGNALYTNECWSDITGSPYEQTLGRGWSEAIPGFDYKIFEKLKSPGAPDALFRREFLVYRKDGEPRWVLGQASPVRNGQGDVAGFVGTMTDITNHKKAEDMLRDYNQQLQKDVHERTIKLQKALDDHARLLADQSRLNDTLVEKTEALKAANEKLNYLATTDALTGVFNRREFMRLAEAELKRSDRYPSSITLMMLDIDHFKSVNDQYGHAAGDEALRQFTRICAPNLRQQDLFGRLGGEEFAILLPETSDAAGLQVAERIRTSLAAQVIPFGEQSFQVTVSIGVACAENGLPDLGILLQRADGALYQAKNEGRDRVSFAGTDVYS